MAQDPTAAPSWHMFAVLGVLVAYLVVFAWFHPAIVTISDEAAYMRQAAAFSRGERNLQRQDPYTGESTEIRLSHYPPGTSLLMAPLMAAGGWRAGFWLSSLSLAVTVLVLAFWLRAENRSPLYALFAMAYPPALVLSRCGMSDLPSAAIVTLGLFSFWRAGGRWPWLLLSGFCAGASWLFRETNPLIFAPFFAGALFRRERATWALVVGGLAGLCARLAASALVFGAVVHTHPDYPGFSAAALTANAPLYFGALLLLIPGGLVFTALYQGPRKVELWLTVSAFLLLHLLYNYNASASAGLKQWVLAPRFFIPLIPLMAFAMAESVPRLWAGLAGKLSVSARVTGNRLAQFGAAAFALAVAAEATLVFWQHAKWSEGQRRVLQALYAASEEKRPVVSNLDATGKFFHELYAPEFGTRTVVDFNSLDEEALRKLLARHVRAQIVLLVRTDSERWHAAQDANAEKIARLSRQFNVQHVSTTLPTDTGETVLVYDVR